LSFLLSYLIIITTRVVAVFNPPHREATLLSHLIKVPIKAQGEWAKNGLGPQSISQPLVYLLTVNQFLFSVRSHEGGHAWPAFGALAD